MAEVKNTYYWLEIAEYDLETARIMMEGKRFLYVGFMCHQAVEKSLKAYYVFFLKDNPPYTHNLTSLAQKIGIYADLSDTQKDLLDLLEPLNVEARYPTNKERITASLTDQKCEVIISKTQEFFQWIKMKLSVK
jgi:HEPN domain-containing protein